MRQKRVVVAVVSDDVHQLLVCYNPNWKGYSFPMAELPLGVAPHGARAIGALERDLGRSFPDAEAEELDYIVLTGISATTGQPTKYHYYLYRVKTDAGLNLPGASAANPLPPLFATYSELEKRPGMTWSSINLVEHFVRNQRAVLAAVTRAGVTETEFLLVWNDTYKGYFFPVKRIKNDGHTRDLARQIVKEDLHYRASATYGYLGQVSNVNFSERFQTERRYTFAVFHVGIPGMDLDRQGNYLESCISSRNGAPAGNQGVSVWVKQSQLGDRSVCFSTNLAGVLNGIAALLDEPDIIPSPLRQSEGGIALIERTANGTKQWLTRYNDRWKAYFFVGGHREGAETFRECVVREIAEKEELGLGAEECPVAAEASHRLEYMAKSESAGVLTAYTMELFKARPTAAGLEKIAADRDNRWLTEEEICNEQAGDDRKVSATVLSLLHQGKLIA